MSILSELDLERPSSTHAHETYINVKPSNSNHNHVCVWKSTADVSHQNHKLCSRPHSHESVIFLYFWPS